MKLRSKFVSYMLLIASVPLALAMTAALWQSSDQTRALTIDIVQGYLDAGASSLSGYFSTRQAEIGTYAESPLLKTMNFQAIQPFLMQEMGRHGGVYEKFILGTGNGHFYNTAGGNPAHGGLRTFDDQDPQSRPKTIARRDYWQHTVGDNTENRQRVYVSEPMISYTTGAKQIVVAASIREDSGKVVGMIGGALPWEAFEKRIHAIFDDLIKHRDWNSRFFLVTGSGMYWYHWDPSYVVRLKKDAQSRPVINEIGEKVTAVRKITEESIPELAAAGHAMIAGKRGYTLFVDPDTGEESYLVYAPIPSAGYAVGLLVPKSEMMAPVTELQGLFGLVLCSALLIVALVAWLLSKRITSPIVYLSSAVKAISRGGAKTCLLAKGDDEVSELTHSFNAMIDSIAAREQSLKDSEERFALAMQGANDGLWDWQLESNELYFSPRWKSMLGYREDEIENRLEAWQELVHPVDLETLTPRLDEFICGKRDKYEAEFRMRHKDGRYRDILSRAIAVRDDANRAVRLVGTHVDITERRRIETEIKQLNEELEKRVGQRTLELEDAHRKQQESEIRHRTILESVVDALITIDERGLIESVNPAAESMFAYSADQITGHSISMLMPESCHGGQGDHAGCRPRVPGNGGDIVGLRSDGSAFPVELSVSEMTIGGARKYTALARDISERKNAEQDLRKESEALTRLNEIAANSEGTFEQKIQQLLALGISTFGLPMGIVSHVEDNVYTVEHILGPQGAPETGTRFKFSETYCAHTYAANGPKAFENAGRSDIADHPCYQTFKLESYIGAPIIVDGRRYGTLNFSSPDAHSRPFSNNELSLIQLLAQWIGNEMSRSHSEQVLGRFKTTLDLTLDCVFMFEPGSLKFFYVNQGAIAQVGYSQKELMNMTPVDIKPDISERDFLGLISPMISGEQPSLNFETIHQHKNGTRIPVEIFLQYINPPNESPRFVAIVRDITERKQATQQLNSTIQEMAVRTKEITSLSELSDLLHSCQNVDEAYEVVARFMPMLLPHLSGALYILDKTGGSLNSVGVWGEQPPQESVFLPQDCVAVRRGLAYFARAEESALFCRHLPESRPGVSFCLPLAAQGETFGLLHLQHTPNRQSATQDSDDILQTSKQEFAGTVAKQISMALASLRLKEELRNQSIRDPLTGLFNRRYMEESFERELHRAARNASSAVAFMMIDIDHFKAINDSYGHDAGDMVLRELAGLLLNMSRKDDIACRFGGEEFVLCLPGATSDIAERRASEIRNAMKQLDLRYNGCDISTVTLSIGVSVYPHNGETSVQLMKSADQALYRAKHSGRDRVVIAEALDPVPLAQA